MSIESFIKKIMDGGDIRPYCNTAMRFGGHVFASDGALLVRVDAALLPVNGFKCADALQVDGYNRITGFDIEGEPVGWSKIQLGEHGRCGHCNGDGNVEHVKCPECDGFGEIELDHSWREHGDRWRITTYTVECTRCGGSGEEEAAGSCVECYGTGVEMNHYPLHGRHINKKYAHAIATHLPDAEIGLIEERGMYKFRHAGLVGIVMPIRV